MEKEEIIADKPVEVSGLTVIPVVQVIAHCYSKKKMISAYCTKKPLFVVIVKASDIKAFDMTGAQIEIDELVDKVPGLREMI